MAFGSGGEVVLHAVGGRRDREKDDDGNASDSTVDGFSGIGNTPSPGTCDDSGNDTATATAAATAAAALPSARARARTSAGRAYQYKTAASPSPSHNTHSDAGNIYSNAHSDASSDEDDSSSMSGSVSSSAEVNRATNKRIGDKHPRHFMRASSPCSSSSESSTITAQLHQLVALQRDGILTEQEFIDAKRKIIYSEPSFKMPAATATGEVEATVTEGVRRAGVYASVPSHSPTPEIPPPVLFGSSPSSPSPNNSIIPRGAVIFSGNDAKGGARARD
jgi:hypothetical protein